MQTHIENLQHQRTLLFLGHNLFENSQAATLLPILARLPFNRVVTMDGDPGLVAFWRRAGRRVQVLTAVESQMSLDENRVAWLALPPPGTTGPLLWARLLRVWLATHHVYFLGCDLEMPLFKQRYREMTAAVGPHRPPYRAIIPHSPPEGDRRYWAQQNVEVIVADPLAWTQGLETAWREAVRAMPPSRTVPPAPAGQPYQFLDYYREADTARFFGRAAAAQNLGELILAESLVVCFGPSGVGKSSLLQAGVMPRLRRQGCLPLYCHPEGDPVQAVRRAVIELPAGLPDKADAPQKLAKLLAALAEQTGQRVVILLDQFEELFTLLGVETLPQLGAELADCLRLSGSPVHLVISLREDFLAHLHQLRPALPTIFTHRYRLKPLTTEEACQAIERPVEPLGLHYQPELTTRLLKDLTDETGLVYPPDLQIICHALYQDLRRSDDTTFRLSRYRELGGKPALLESHLERVVEAEANPTRIRAVLKTMVTAQGTRVILTAPEIAYLAELESRETEKILARLDRSHRLVRSLQGQESTRYELTHEVLGPRILAWIEDPAEKAAKAVHDLLRAELHNWRNFEALPGPGKLQAVYAQRRNPHLRLTAADLELIVRGAIHHNLETAYWLEQAAQAGLPTGDFLQPALDAPQPEVRRRAARLLGEEAAMPTLRKLSRSSDSAVRHRAVETVAGLDWPQARQLWQRMRHDAAEAVRATAWQALEARYPRAAARLRHRDQILPLLIAGSLVYWGLAALAWSTRFATVPFPILAVAGGLWPVAVLGMIYLIPRLPRRLLAWTGGGLTAWLLIAGWGWWKGSIATLFLIEMLGSQPHLALVALLPYLSLLLFPEPTPGLLLGATGATIVVASLLAFLVPRWGRYGTDRSPGLAFLVAVWGGAMVGFATPGGWPLGLTLALCLAVGRRAARRPLAYSGGSQNILALLADLGRAAWDVLDTVSFKLKPFIGSVGGALWAGVLFQAAAGLAPGALPPWTVGDSLWLGLGLSLGLWFEGGLFRRLARTALLGAAGGWLAQGWSGAFFGAMLGLILAFGEWLATKQANESNKEQLLTGA